MKKITCQDCDKVFQSETEKDILDQMYSHYMDVHKDIITKADESEKKAWMERFNKDWEKAEQVSL